jgi:hypothetical protein
MESSIKNEYYTPPSIISMVKEVLGEIELDPFSCEFANTNYVKAKRYFDKERSCYLNEWGSPKTIFSNPPYSDGEYGPAIEKLMVEIYGTRCESIILTNNNTQTIASNMLLKLSQAVCFPLGRINYYKPDGTCEKNNRHSQMLTYFGPDKYKYQRVFEEIGVVFFK